MKQIILIIFAICMAGTVKAQNYVSPGSQHAYIVKPTKMVRQWGAKYKNTSKEMVNLIFDFEGGSIFVRLGGLKQHKVWMNVETDEGLMRFRRVKGVRSGRALLTYLKNNLKHYEFVEKHSTALNSASYKGTGGASYIRDVYEFKRKN